MRHKYHDLIVAWAKGSKIQQRNPSVTDLADWHHFDGHWGGSEVNDTWEYRLHEEPPKELVLHCFIDATGCEFTVVKANLRLTYDGASKKLIKADVL
jgi:hypothetical protein